MREVYAQAENAYRIGRIEQARELLLQNLSTLQGNSRQSALRLIALTYMDDYDIPKAEQYVTLLLQQNPYYSPSAQDPATFIEIVNNIKAGMTPTITTASSQAESLAEVPVPTTLITAEMIKTSGARNLQEVLAAYVPGMNLIDCNDDQRAPPEQLRHQYCRSRLQYLVRESEADRGAARPGLVALWRCGTDGSGEHHHQTGY